MKVDVQKIDGEWCAFHAETGREIARAKNRALLDGYLSDCESLPALTTYDYNTELGELL